MTSPAEAPPLAANPFGPCVETPEFFESGDRPVFGMAFAPTRRKPGAPVVVHCHSLGVEQITSYRCEVLTARATAGRGIPTFRYHARGHGDSGGDFADVTLQRLVDDAMAAADRARAISGAERIVFLGVRFGALVAAHAATRRRDVAGIALWEPALRGIDHFRGVLRSLLLSQVAAGRAPGATVDGMMQSLEATGALDVHGYLLHAAVVRSAGAAVLDEPLVRARAPVFLAQVQGRPALTRAHRDLAAQLESAGLAVTTEVVREEPGWHFNSNPAWRSPDLTARSVEWFDALA